jgi:NitT/TauT family transport system ATP-binding protein
MKLIVNGLFKSYAKNGTRLAVFEEVSFEIREGEFVSIVGPSGCGKSTLLKCIAGLIRPDKGSVFFEGMTHGPETAFVFQELHLLPWRTVRKNVSFGLEELGLPKAERRQRVEKAITLMGLRGFEDYYPRELSGGMRQRVAIARAMVLEPRLLLMDEPMASLDAITAQELQVELMKVVAQKRQSVLYVTHSIPEAVFLSDRVLVMTKRPGKIKAELVIEEQRPRERAFKTTLEYVRYLEMLWNLLD